MKYVVYLTMYSGSLLPKFYIGSSNISKVNNGYNGTVKSKRYSKIFNSEQKQNKGLFKTRVLSFHKLRKEALEEELRIQQKHKVVENINYINESYAQINGYFGRNVSGKLNPFFNKLHSSESKQLMRETKLKPIIVDGEETTLSKESAKKFSKTVLSTYVDSDGSETTIAKEINKKRVKTINQKFINEKGEETTIALEMVKKHTKYLKTKIIVEDKETTIGRERGLNLEQFMSKIITDENGNKTTLKAQAQLKGVETRRKNKQRYNIHNIFNDIVIEGVYKVDVINITRALLNTTKENYLGKNPTQLGRLKRFNKLEHHGAYITLYDNKIT